MPEKTGFFRSLFRGLADMHELAIIPIALAMAFIALIAMPFVEKVDHDEVVVCESRFGGETEVWRGWLVDGWRWQGLGKVTTYHAEAGRKFTTEIDVGGTRYVVRGTARFRVFGDDAKILAIHRTYGSEDAIAERHVLPAVDAALREAAADPSWTRLEGDFIERKLKGALEYGLKRVSPTGAIWTSPETRRRLQDDLTRRLTYAPDAAGIGGQRVRDIPVTVELGFVTER